MELGLSRELYWTVMVQKGEVVKALWSLSSLASYQGRQ